MEAKHFMELDEDIRVKLMENWIEENRTKLESGNATADHAQELAFNILSDGWYRPDGSDATCFDIQFREVCDKADAMWKDCVNNMIVINDKADRETLNAIGIEVRNKFRLLIINKGEIYGF